MKKIFKKYALPFIILLCSSLLLPSQTAEAASKPSKPTIKSIASKSEGQITVKWKKVNCKGYQIQLASNSRFTKNKKAIKISGKNATEKTISSLKAGQKYYVRVRAYKKYGKKIKYGKWSSKKTIKTHKHSYKGKVAKKASCTSTGIRTYSCSCQQTYKEEIIETAHSLESTTFPEKIYCIDQDAYNETVTVQTGVIHHDAVEGHYETHILKEAYDEPIVDKNGNTITIHHEEETEEIWIEKQEAYDEPVYEEQIVHHEEVGHYETQNVPGYKCASCGVRCIRFTTNGATYAIPYNTNSNSSIVSVKNTSGKTYKYKIYKQSASFSSYNDYLTLHGCSTCALTTLLNAKVPALSNYSPDKVISVVEKATFGEKVFNKNYNKKLKSQMPVTLYGTTKILDKYKVKYKYVYNYADNSAVNEITAHLKTGNPVMITLRKKNNDTKWASSVHTLLLIGLDEEGNAIVCDSSNRSWSDNNQRIKYGNIKELVSYMWSSSKASNNVFYSGSTGSSGYILIY